MGSVKTNLEFVSCEIETFFDAETRIKTSNH